MWWGSEFFIQAETIFLCRDMRWRCGIVGANGSKSIKIVICTCEGVVSCFEYGIREIISDEFEIDCHSPTLKVCDQGASQVAQWLRSVPAETLISRPGSVITGRDREVRGVTLNWPSVVRVREGLAGRDVLASSRTSDSCGGPVAVRANQGCQVHGVSSDTFGAAGFRVGCALC